MTQEDGYEYRVSVPILATIEIFLLVPKSEVQDLQEDEIPEIEEHPAFKKALFEIQESLRLEASDYKEVWRGYPSEVVMDVESWEILDSDSEFYEVELDKLELDKV